MSDCPHQYEPRYDLVTPLDGRGSMFWSVTQEKNKVYVGDRCTKCGDWKPRP